MILPTSFKQKSMIM